VQVSQGRLQTFLHPAKIIFLWYNVNMKMIPKKNFRTIVKERHIITDIKEIKVGNYVMIKGRNYFRKINPYYGFNGHMESCCGTFLKVKTIHHDFDDLWKITFEKPKEMSDKQFELYINEHSWNNEMVIPAQTFRTIKL
jgi:hypothetical protein